MLETITATPATSALPAVRSLVDRDEYGPSTGRPGGLFTASTVPSLLDGRDDVGKHAVQEPD